MSQPFLGQILTFAGNFAPYNYMLCAGQLLSIAQFDALFALIGTTYGGDGVGTFALPDLRSRVPVHVGTGPGLSTYVLGQNSGFENITLVSNNLPSHSHPVNIVTAAGNLAAPGGSAYLAGEFQDGPAVPTYLTYSSANAQVALAPNTIGLTGNSLPHYNIQPVQALNYCIAVNGIFPTQG